MIDKNKVNQHSTTLDDIFSVITEFKDNSATKKELGDPKHKVIGFR